MRTVDAHGVLVDVGATFFTDFYPRAMSLLDTCGLRRELIPFPLAAGVEHGGTVTPVWPVADFLRGGLLSPMSLARLGAGTLRLVPGWSSLDPGDLLRAVRYDTRTAESWVREVLGDEVADLLIAPVLRGVVHWELGTTSQAVLFSMMKAVTKYRGAYRLRDGMSSLCERLGASLDVRCSTRVTSVTRSGDRWLVDAETRGAERQLEADGLICATTASVVPKLFPDFTHEQRAFFEGIRYSSTVVAVVRAPARQERPHTSILFARTSESPPLAGITPAGSEHASDTETVKISLTDAAYQSVAGLPDRELGRFILDTARRNRALTSWLADADVVEVVRWEEALPVFDVGHLRTIRQWQSAPQLPALAFAGDYLAGPYVEGAIRSGADAAAVLLAELSSPPR